MCSRMCASPIPGGCKHPAPAAADRRRGGWCGSQFLAGDTDAGRRVGARWGGSWPPPSTCLAAGFSLGAGMVPDGRPVACLPRALAPWPEDQEMSSPGLFPGLSLLQPSPSQAEDAAPPARPCLPPHMQPLTAPGPQASLLSHRPARPPGWAAASKGRAHVLGDRTGWGRCVRAMSSPQGSLHRGCCRAGGASRGWGRNWGTLPEVDVLKPRAELSTCGSC